jgi:hypothetical protein
VLACPSESSVALLARRRHRRRASSRNPPLVQSSWPVEVPRLLVLQSHFAVGHSLGCVVFLRRAALTTLSDQCALSSSFAFLQSLAQHNLARPPQPPSTSHGLLLPTALQDSEIHWPRALPAPATVRPQGLVTLSAVCALRARAGFVSHRRRSWDSPFGAFSFRKVSAAFPGGSTRVPFLPSVIPPPKRWAGPTGRGFRASTLPGVPGDRRCVSTATAGCSLGLRPSRVYRRKPCPGLHPDSSHALFGRRPCGRRPRRRGVSISLRLVPSAARQAGRWTGQPF